MKLMTKNRLCKQEVARSFSVEGSVQRACYKKIKPTNSFNNTEKLLDNNCITVSARRVLGFINYILASADKSTVLVTSVAMFSSRAQLAQIRYRIHS